MVKNMYSDIEQKLTEIYYFTYSNVISSSVHTYTHHLFDVYILQ